jgi:microtubule-associated protein-like 6
VFAKVSNSAISCLIRQSPGMLIGGPEVVKLVDAKMQTVAEVKIGKGRARAICVGPNGDMAVGTSLAEIHLFRGFASNNNAVGTVVVQSHHDGELWGLAVSPSGNEIATIGEDNKLMIWDPRTHKLLRSGPISSEPIEGVARRVIRRAASTTNEVQARCGRSVSWSPDGRHIAAGLNTGCVSIYDAHSLNVLVTRDLNNFGKPKSSIPENWISDLKYSPDGRVLAAATHGSVIVLLDVGNNYAAREKLKPHNSPVVHIDWSSDSSHLQSSCMGYEFLFHNVTEEIVGSAQNTRASSLKNVQWASQTLPFGWSVSGLVTPAVTGDFYNCVARSNSSTLIATGDDNGVIKLFRYPMAAVGNQSRNSKAHSSHVMNVCFSRDDQYLYSVGGGDKSLMQWRVVGGASAGMSGGAGEFEI